MKRKISGRDGLFLDYTTELQCETQSVAFQALSAQFSPENDELLVSGNYLRGSLFEVWRYNESHQMLEDFEQNSELLLPFGRVHSHVSYIGS